MVFYLVSYIIFTFFKFVDETPDDEVEKKEEGASEEKVEEETKEEKEEEKVEEKAEEEKVEEPGFF